MRHILVLLGVCMFLSVRGAEAQPSYPFQDSTLTVEARLNDLVERMTLEEKIDLLAGYEDFIFIRVNVWAFRPLKWQTVRWGFRHGESGEEQQLFRLL